MIKKMICIISKNGVTTLIDPDEIVIVDYDNKKLRLILKNRSEITVDMEIDEYKKIYDKFEII